MEHQNTTDQRTGKMTSPKLAPISIPRVGRVVHVQPTSGDTWEARIVAFTEYGSLVVKSTREGATHEQTIDPSSVFVEVQS